jgi:hypothetical protein
VAAALERRARQAEWAATQRLLWEGDTPEWGKFSAGLLRARERAESAGTRFVVLLFPLLVPAPGGLVSTAAHRRLTAFCAEEALPCLDLEPEFEGRDLDALRVDPQDFHAGPEAHRIVGAALARWLRDTDQLSIARRFQR